MRCCRCKRDLPEEAFYPSDKYRCKECTKVTHRKAYKEARKAMYGITINDKGQYINYQGKKKSIHWTGNMLSELKRYFPTTKNKELAELLRVSERTLVRKARELGIGKNPEWLANTSRTNGFIGYFEYKNGIEKERHQR